MGPEELLKKRKIRIKKRKSDQQKANINETDTKRGKFDHFEMNNITTH